MQSGQNFKEREDSEYRADEANNDVQQSCFLNTLMLTVSRQNDLVNSFSWSYQPQPISLYRDGEMRTLGVGSNLLTLTRRAIKQQN
jgi:hypothetical protein